MNRLCLIMITLAILALLPLQVEGKTEPSPLLKQDLEQLLAAAKKETSTESFASFLKWASTATKNPGVTAAVAAFSAGKPLDEFRRDMIARLLGVYTRLRYKDDAIVLLEKLVAIPTFKRGDTPQHENPNIKKFGKLIESTAKSFGLSFQNVNDRIFVVELKGSGPDTFGILTHGDVVPALKENWGLEDGTKLHPFKMKIVGDRIYGRGTEDDKASITSALLAMKAIKEGNIPLKRTIRLMIETTEETGGEGIAYYKARHKVPSYNIVLDSSYPAVIAEKGYGTVTVKFPVQKSTSEKGAVIESISGGMAVNQIPQASVARLRTTVPVALAKALDKEIKAFVGSLGNDFRMSTRTEKDRVILTVEGKSAHSSSPSSGVNPVSRMFVFLHQNAKLFSPNHFTVAARYAAENWGTDYLGKKMGIAYEDEFMGPLTAAVTYIDLEKDRLEVSVNIRAPRPRSVKELRSEIESKLKRYFAKNRIEADLSVTIGDWMYRNPQGAWLQTLLAIFGETTGLPSTPVSSSGGTTAKQLPNAINFGPSFPGDIYRGHTANEFKSMNNFMLDLQMFTEMMVRIGNLKSLGASD